jgi:hypothetical protein
MIVSCAEPVQWSAAEIQHQIRKLYPLRRMFRNFEFGEPLWAWHPWFFCMAEIRLDTAIKKGQVHADLVAVDSVRPIRQRLLQRPEFKPADLAGQRVIKPRLTQEMAGREAHEMLTTVVLSRNKLLLKHNISVVNVEMHYFRVMIIPVEGMPFEDWPAIEEFFGNSNRLGMRRELQEVLTDIILEPVKI